MTGERPSTGTAAVNGLFRGAAAQNWSLIQESQFRPGYATVLDRCEVGPGID